MLHHVYWFIQDDIQVDEHLNYGEMPVMILDIKMKTFHNKVIGFVKVTPPEGFIMELGS